MKHMLPVGNIRNLGWIYVRIVVIKFMVQLDQILYIQNKFSHILASVISFLHRVVWKLAFQLYYMKSYDTVIFFLTPHMFFILFQMSLLQIIVLNCPPVGRWCNCSIYSAQRGFYVCFVQAWLLHPVYIIVHNSCRK